MKIESIIRRQTGSTVKMGDRVYRFVAGTDGRHVCEVEDEAHIDRLLSIREGFRAVDGAQEPAQDQDDKPKAKPRKPKGSAQEQDDKPAANDQA